MRQLTVGVFDDHDIFARGVMAILREDPMITALTPDLDHADHLDVAVVSKSFIGQTAICCPTVACISLHDAAPTSSAADWLVAVLHRETMTPDQLYGAVHVAGAGLRLHWGSSASSAALDDRSRSVLRLLADGARTREISDELGYSERTVKGMIQQIEQLLGARSRAHAVAVAVRTSLI